MSMYLRIKRKNQTMFLHVEPSDNFGSIKNKIADYYKKESNQINLYVGNTEKKREIVDMATVSDQEIKNDDVLYMAFQKESGSGWEDISIESFSNENAQMLTDN